jgi:asparagine synthase (glutamine-hydrolysing)
MSYQTLVPGEGSRKRAEILASNYFDLEHTYPLSRQLFLDKDVKQLRGSKTLVNNTVFEWITESLRPPKDAFSLPFLSKVSLAELHTYLGHTLLRDTDMFSMAHSLEVRTPFLDHKLVTKVLALPDSLKPPRSSSHPPKSLLVKALDGIVSEDLSMREKQGFVLPWDAWLKGPLAQIYSEGIDALASSELIQERALKKILSSSTWSRKWSLSVLGYYLKRHGLR